MNTKIILVTVSDDRGSTSFGKVQDRVSELFSHDNRVEVHAYKWEDIHKTEFYRKNKILLDNTDVRKNGLAYKPYVILKELKKLRAGEFLVYNDVSPEIWENVGSVENYDIEIIKQLCVQSNDILTPFIRWSSEGFKSKSDLGMATHHNFTMDRTMKKMGLLHLKDHYLHSAAMYCFRKSKFSVGFVEEWLKWNCNDECSTVGHAKDPSDFSYWEAEKDRKLGFVYDQSVSGLLLAKRNHSFVMSPPYAVGRVHPSNFLQYCLPNIQYEFTAPQSL